MINNALYPRVWSFVFIFPAVLLVLVFFLFPVLFLIGTSLTNWTGGTFATTDFVGVKNYVSLGGNEDFWASTSNTVIWMLSAVIIHVPLAFLVALILFRKPRGWKLMRIAYFFPQIVAPMAMAFLWIFIFNPNFGVVNPVLEGLGLGGLRSNWLGSPNTALGSIIFSWIFNIGFFMVIFLSQLGTIPNELYEAAEMDGANIVQKDWHISLPMMRGTIGVTILLALTNAFKAFELPYIMTGGGPGASSQILPIFMYKQMLENKAGRANALGLIILVLGTAVVLGVMKFTRLRKEA